ncbi:MAG: chromate resistance protein, partial [Mesorhizobium sp.]
IACSWLIRRFIDADAIIRFVAGKGYVPKEGELRFDMFEGEITHEGDRCSFEVLLTRAAINDPALQAIAEIVHDIDLKDNKFGREEATGIASLIAGIAMANESDEERIAQGAPVFDNLYQYFRKKRG